MKRRFNVKTQIEAWRRELHGTESEEAVQVRVISIQPRISKIDDPHGFADECLLLTAEARRRWPDPPVEYVTLTSFFGAPHGTRPFIDRWADPPPPPRREAPPTRAKAPGTPPVERPQEGKAPEAPVRPRKWSIN
jgi:hypothetical protein